MTKDRVVATLRSEVVCTMVRSYDNRHSSSIHKFIELIIRLASRVEWFFGIQGSFVPKLPNRTKMFNASEASERRFKRTLVCSIVPNWKCHIQ